MGNITVDLGERLYEACVQAKSRAKTARDNEDLYKAMVADRDKAIKNRDLFVEVANKMTAIYKDTERYLAEKKKNSLEDLNLALEAAGTLVPASDTNNIHILVNDNKTAEIVNEKGYSINAIEGSAQRTVISLIMAYTCLLNKPGYVQALFLDETFFTLDSNTIMEVRELLKLLSKDILIVGIEQHGLIFEGIADMIYKVSKENGVSKVRLIEDGRT